MPNLLLAPSESKNWKKKRLLQGQGADDGKNITEGDWTIRNITELLGGDVEMQEDKKETVGVIL